MNSHPNGARSRSQLSKPSWLSECEPSDELEVFARRARYLLRGFEFPITFRHGDQDQRCDLFCDRVRAVKSDHQLEQLLQRFNWAWFTLSVKHPESQKWVPLRIDDRSYCGHERVGRQPQDRINWHRASGLDHKVVFQRYPRTRIRQYMGYCAPGNRGKVIYRIAKALRSEGAQADEIACVLLASGAWKSKRDEQGTRWGRQEIERICAKMREQSND